MSNVQPLCPVYDVCGGCSYQDKPYDEELRLKEEYLQNSFYDSGLSFEQMDSIIESPEPYYYRHRIDLRLRRTRDKGLLIGFSQGKYGVVEIEECPIARKEISEALASIKNQVIKDVPDKYRTANIVIRTSQDKGVHWGGIGRGSLKMEEEDYLWTDVGGRRIYFALGTFFQANFSILSKLMEHFRSFDFWDKQTTLYDLYGGVGLFTCILYDKVQRVVYIEQNIESVKLARYNIAQHSIENVSVSEGDVEEHFSRELNKDESERKVVLVDPPRNGLSPEAIEKLSAATQLSRILYLSCKVDSLIRDLKCFVEKGWKIEQVSPFDFFPKTKHVETLVVLKKEKSS